MMKGSFFLKFNTGELRKVRKLKKALAFFGLLLILCGSMAGITVSAFEEFGTYDGCFDNYFYGSYPVTMHYCYRFPKTLTTLSAVVLVFVLIWLYGRKIRKNELPKA